MKEDAPQRTYALRDVFDAVRWMAKAACPWRLLPGDLPPWNVVEQQSKRWIRAGVFEAMVHDLRMIIRLLHERAEQPTAMIKRAAAMKTLGWKEAKCQMVDVQDADERLVRLLEANRQHVPTTEQKIRIGEVYFDLETKRAKARQVAGAKAAKKGVEVVETLSQPQTKPGKGGDDAVGKSRDLAAKRVGLCGVSFDRGLKTLKAAEKAEQDGKKETAAELRQILNEKGIDPAYSHAKSLHLIEQAPRATVPGAKLRGRSCRRRVPVPFRNPLRP